MKPGAKDAPQRSEVDQGPASEHTYLATGRSQFSSLPARTFGSLQGIKLHRLLVSGLDVGGEITGAVFPLNLWLGAGLAINALR